MTDKSTEDQQSKINLDPVHTPILYTDMVFLRANKDGVTLDICQRTGDANHLQVISRIGMSREQGTKLAKHLSEVLALSTAHSETGDKN